ncbi:hypothetical protein F4809DRAFT_658425 [Biscogniauxia mediterranea]|nr:hypothetical protein F4809DRAFT_658425 [Biscogniauxia mediterranea]
MNHHRSMTLAHPRREPQPQPQQQQQLLQQRSWLARLHGTMCILVLLRALAALLTELARPGHARALVHGLLGAAAAAASPGVRAVAARGGEGAIAALARTEGVALAPVPACYCYPLAGCGAVDEAQSEVAEKL